jgi:hypothetical protein
MREVILSNSKLLDGALCPTIRKSTDVFAEGLVSKKVEAT